MFWQKLKHALTKKSKVYSIKQYKIADPGFIAICIIFLQNIIHVDGLDGYQTLSLISFLIAIPVLAIHFFTIQMLPTTNMHLPAYLAKSFEFLFLIGWFCTFSGVGFVLFRVSLFAPFIYTLSFAIGMAVYFRIKLYTIRSTSIAMEDDEIIYD